MGTLPETGKPSFWSVVLKKAGKFLKLLIILLVVVCSTYVYWKYFYTYSSGYRAGTLQKFSSKGMIFKTYEGEMILSSITSSREVVLASEKFHFTMVNHDLIRQFDTLQGEMVIVHYMQKNGALFWRGDSEYLVDSIRLKR